MPLEDAPKKFTKQVHLRLHTAHLKPENIESAFRLASENPGKCPLFLCMIRPGGELVFIAAHERFSVLPSTKLQQSIDEMFGEETYYAKVDTTPPERPRRKWEQRGGGEED